RFRTIWRAFYAKRERGPTPAAGPCLLSHKKHPLLYETRRGITQKQAKRPYFFQILYNTLFYGHIFL
ncbi:MAG TPA: hypothetical protein DEF06_08460, partial [Clostridiales bacterium]|nr:hypothetical protein [Clostridiales bacterium]